MRLGVLAGLLSLSIACDSGDPPAESSPAPAAPVEPAQAVAAPIAATGGKAATGAVAASAASGATGSTADAKTGALEAVKALPKIDLAEHDGQEEARKLNRAALEQHKDQDYVASAEGFMAAVRKDPGHVVARYNLACALAMQGDADAAFEVLGQLETAGCPQCLGQVLVAHRDSDWDKVRNDPRLRKAVRRVRDGLPEPKDAAKSIATWFKKFGDDEPFGIDPRRSIKIEYVKYMGESSDKEKSKLTGPARLERWVKKRSKEAMNGFSSAGQDIICNGECCAFEALEGINHHTLYLSEICFKMEGKDPVYVKSLKFFED